MCEQPNTLVDAEWLANKLAITNEQNDDFRLLHVSWMDGDYIGQPGHIAGAWLLDGRDAVDATSKYRNTVPTTDQFEKLARSLNITNRTHVVVYDASTSAPNIDGGAARIWWTFLAMSHTRVSVLDGGIVAWLGSGRTLVDGPNPIQEAFNTASPKSHNRLFTARFNADVYVSYEEMLQISQGEQDKASVIDVRPAQQYNGDVPPNADADTKAMYGHIKNTSNLPIYAIVDPLTKRIFDTATLATVLPADCGDALVCSCLTGKKACAMALAAYTAGRSVRVYDGSWSEFVDRAAADAMVRSQNNVNTNE